MFDCEQAPALDRAVAAFLDVVKHWAADGFAQLREEFRKQQPSAAGPT